MESWMERVGSVSVLMVGLILILHPLSCVYANDEGNALVAFKNNLRDPQNALVSWDSTLVNPCSWLHITCDGGRNVIRVDLGNSGLSGQLVPELGRLTKLQYLQLYENDLSGPIPPQLGDLASLVSLNLGKNSITGTPPAELGKLLNLKFLRLNDNKLSGCIPLGAWRSIIPHLVVVDVSNNPNLQTKATDPRCKE